MGDDGEVHTQIDAVAEKASWSIANVREAYNFVSRGVASREFALNAGHGFASCRKGHLHSTD
jgi:hypothetical protein